LAAGADALVIEVRAEVEAPFVSESRYQAMIRMDRPTATIAVSGCGALLLAG